MNNNKQTINNTIPTTLPILNLNNNVLLPFEVLEFEADNSPLVLWTLQKIQKEFNKYFILTYSDDVEGENNNVVSTLALLNSFTIKNEKLYVNLGGVNRVQIKDIHQVRADKFMLSTGEYKHILLDNHFTKAQQETMQKIIHKSTAFEPSVFVTSTYKEIKPLLDANKWSDVMDMILSKMKLYKGMKSLFLKTINPEMRIELFINLFPSFQLKELPTVDTVTLDMKEVKSNSADDEEFDSMADEYLDRIEKAKIPTHVVDRLLEEVENFDDDYGTGDAAKSKKFIDFCLSLPWNKSKKENLNIIKAKKILNKSHYGLDKVKARVVEYLVARKNSEKVGTQILCLTGAPGTGKTTICKSIAEAINKPFVKVALGGVSDESILFGSDSVYIGSHAGRILKAVKSTGVNNCLLMLDEIDKVFNNGTQSGGNINARLLELLDPSQNKTFVDHYLDLEFDMSKIMFVCTANYLDQIPAALKDRLEIIHIEQYTPEEKQHIAEKYLIPAALKEYNLHKLEISFTKDAVTYIVEKFTHEAGVRELNQKIHSICRKFLVERDEGQIFTCKVTQELVDKYLTEKEKYEKYKVAEKPQIGVCNCLYYSEAGGGSEPISCTLFKGTGKLVLSGQVGKAEEHACNIALGYIKSNVRKFGLSKIDFKKIDIQLTTSQVPDNPSDGSSATWVTCSAILSKLKNIPISNHFSGTGSMSLNGEIIKIGGLKEKLIGAVQAGIDTVCIPKGNEKDLDDVPASIKEKLQIHIIKEYDDVYQILFKKEKRSGLQNIPKK